MEQRSLQSSQPGGQVWVQTLLLLVKPSPQGSYTALSTHSQRPSKALTWRQEQQVGRRQRV